MGLWGYRTVPPPPFTPVLVLWRSPLVSSYSAPDQRRRESHQQEVLCPSNSIAFSKAPPRGARTLESVSQSVSQSLKKSQAVNSAGRQGGRQVATPSLDFWRRSTSKGGGEHIACSVASWLNSHSARLSQTDSFDRIQGMHSAAGRPETVFHFADQGSNLSKHKTFDPQTFDPPTLTPTASPPQIVPRYKGGGGGSKSKHSLDDHCVSQNDDFTSG